MGYEDEEGLYDDLYYYNEDMQGMQDEIDDANSFDTADEDLFTAENLKQWGGGGAGQ